MANLDDYIDWRGDVPFSVDPFNEVDNLLLTEIVYTPLDGLISGPSCREKILLTELSDRFFSKYTEEELMNRPNMTKLAPFLMRKMAYSKRFEGTKVAGFVNEVDAETTSQFACMTFYLPDNTIYVAFRGTDDSLIGWQEDFNMCFSHGTAGQLKAVKYLNDNFSRTLKRLRVGGHSKGGNFAVYASAFCRESVKDNIDWIYSNDGPGFIDEITNSEKYSSIIDRVISTIPEESIIGLLMERKYDSKIIKSANKGINQHDPLSWQILGNHFVEADQVKASYILLDETIKKWAMDFDYETRDIFCNLMFQCMEASGAKKLSEITGSKLSSLSSTAKSINALDKEQQTLIYNVLGRLISYSGGALKHSFIERLTSIQQLIPRKS